MSKHDIRLCQRVSLASVKWGTTIKFNNNSLRIYLFMLFKTFKTIVYQVLARFKTWFFLLCDTIKSSTNLSDWENNCYKWFTHLVSGTCFVVVVPIVLMLLRQMTGVSFASSVDLPICSEIIIKRLLELQECVVSVITVCRSLLTTCRKYITQIGLGLLQRWINLPYRVISLPWQRNRSINCFELKCVFPPQICIKHYLCSYSRM